MLSFRFHHADPSDPASYISGSDASQVVTAYWHAALDGGRFESAEAFMRYVAERMSSDQAQVRSDSPEAFLDDLQSVGLLIPETPVQAEPVRRSVFRP